MSIWACSWPDVSLLLGLNDIYLWLSGSMLKAATMSLPNLTWERVGWWSVLGSWSGTCDVAVMGNSKHTWKCPACVCVLFILSLKDRYVTLKICPSSGYSCKMFLMSCSRLGLLKPTTRFLQRLPTSQSSSELSSPDPSSLEWLGPAKQFTSVRVSHRVMMFDAQLSTKVTSGWKTTP